MPKFRKKPIIVEAEQMIPGYLPPGVKSKSTRMGPMLRGDFCSYWVETLEGDLRINFWDWIVTGIFGEKYPVNPEIFKELYEPVDQD